MRVSVLIPYRGTCPQRARVLRWVEARWRAAAPEFEVILGSASSSEWRKGLALRDAVERSAGELLVVSDADVWTDHVRDAVETLTGAGWVIPHRTVGRLSEPATEEVLAGAEPSGVAERLGLQAFSERPYDGRPGGGMVILSRDAYGACPMDARFAGWGGEDEAWGIALNTLLGSATRLPYPLWHLWHPPAPRLNRVVGSQENDRLRARYFQAFGDRAQVRELVREGQLVEGITSIE